MYRLILLTIFFIGCLSEHVEEYSTSHKDVFKNHDSFFFVEFYAPWCGHCQALVPEYEKLAKSMKELSEGAELPQDVYASRTEAPEDVELAKSIAKQIRIFKVDATNHTELASEHEVKAFPTIKLILKSGNSVVYQGGRTAKEMFEFLIRKCGPPAKEISKLDHLNNLVENNKVFVFGYFKDPKANALHTFSKVADIMGEPSFAYTSLPEVAKGVKIDTDKYDDCIILFRKFDEGPLYHYGPFSTDDITHFVKSNKMPLVSEFNQDNANEIFTEENHKHILLFEDKNATKHEENMKRFKEAAKELKGKILFVYIDSGEDTNDRILEFFGIKKEELPTVRIINLAVQMKKYKPDEVHDSADASLITSPQKLVAFVNEFLEGKLKPHLLTEEIPTDWDSKPVKVLVGKNFEEQVMKSNKKVLVEFYAPWCHHCKQFEPIYDTLGEEYLNRSDDIMIAKINSPSNELENVTIESFPTIKLFLPKEGQETKTIIDFGGERTLESLKEFLESDGTKNAQAENEDGEGEDTEPYDDDEEGAGVEDHTHEHTEL